MPGHRDWDASVVWQANALFAQTSGNIPVAGTVIFSGPITNFPSLLIRGFGQVGGFRLKFDWYLDVALTLNVGTDVFDAPQGWGFFGVYEVQAPFVKISIANATVAPVA